MKPELPFAMLFSLPWAKQGSAQLALCLETSPVNVTESFACVGTRYYLRQLNPGWDISAGVGLRGDWGYRERSWAEDCAHLRQLLHISLCGSTDLTGSVIAAIMDHQRTASLWHSFFSTVSNLLCSSSAGTQLPKCPKQKRYTHFFTWREDHLLRNVLQPTRQLCSQHLHPPARSALLEEGTASFARAQRYSQQSTRSWIVFSSKIHARTSFICAAFSPPTSSTMAPALASLLGTQHSPNHWSHAAVGAKSATHHHLTAPLVEWSPSTRLPGAEPSHPALLGPLPGCRYWETPTPTHPHSPPAPLWLHFGLYPKPWSWFTSCSWSSVASAHGLACRSDAGTGWRHSPVRGLQPIFIRAAGSLPGL